jgi:prepilin-type N-terminal cleavage/methylation domain-containing protein
VLTTKKKPIFHLKLDEITSGFSLVELMIVLSVLSILFAVGLPAFGRLLHDIEIRGNAEGLRAALQTARTEAVTRNALVRISFNDVSGQPAWTLGCVHASARCPGTISAYRASAEVKVRWGAAHADDEIAPTAALTAGNRLPSGVTFNALGAAPGVSSGVDASRIDVLHSANDQARRLILTIAGAGTVRLCDPSAGSDSTFRCS